MADQLGSAVLTVSVDDSQFKAGLNNAQRQAQAASQKIEGSFKGLSGALGSIGSIAGLVGIGALTQQLISTGKESEQTKIQLNALAGAYGESARAAEVAQRAQQILALSALDARQGFAKLYGALRGAGIGLDQLEVLFIGINKAARLSGVGTQEASNALIQLKQGLSSGRLAGDELRSVLEQLPVFAQAIAKEMGVSVGQLRDLGSQGKITSDVIFNAAKQLATAAVPARTQAEQLGIAFTNLKESAAEALGPALVGLLSNLTAGIAAFGQYLKENQQTLASFGKSVINIGKTLLPFAVGILAVRAAFRAWAIAAKGVAIAQAAVLALQGPKGWVVLAAAIGAAAVAANLLENGYKGIESAVGKAGKEAEKARAQFAALLGGTSLEPGPAPVDAKKEARSRVQLVESEQVLNAIRRQIAAAQELANAEAGVVRETIRQRQEIEAGVKAARERVQLIGAQIEALRLQGTDGGAEFDKLVADQVAASEEVRLKLIEGATALKDAGKQLSADLKAATLELAGIRNNPQGLNQYLNQQQIQERGQATLQSILPAFRDAQALFTRLTGAQAPEFRGTTSGVIDGVLKFIEQVNREDLASKGVANIQEALNKNTENLTNVNTELVAVVRELAAKRWNVNVNVPGGSASGDVVGAVNGAF